MNPYGRPDSCQGTQAQLPNQCQCSDPGVVATGQDILVADANLCPRRLLPLRDGSGNVLGAFIVYGGTGQQEAAFATQQPSVALPAVATAADQSFGSLVVCTGAAGVFSRITPPGAANLFLQTDGAGAILFGAPPGATIPDPLSIGTLNLATALNLAGGALATFAGPITATGLSAGTAVSLLGLNGSNQFILSPPVASSKAWFYESVSRTSTGYPNQTLGNNSFCVLAGTLYNADGIVTLSNNIATIATAGTYQIDWSGLFAPPSNGNYSPGISLVYNGNVINPGMRGGNQSAGSGYPGSVEITGSHVMAVNTNDQFQLKITYTGTPPTQSQLQDVQIIFTKFK